MNNFKTLGCCAESKTSHILPPASQMSYRNRSSNRPTPYSMAASPRSDRMQSRMGSAVTGVSTASPRRSAAMEEKQRSFASGGPFSTGTVAAPGFYASHRAFADPGPRSAPGEGFRTGEDDTAYATSGSVPYSLPYGHRGFADPGPRSAPGEGFRAGEDVGSYATMALGDDADRGAMSGSPRRQPQLQLMAPGSPRASVRSSGSGASALAALQQALRESKSAKPTYPSYGGFGTGFGSGSASGFGLAPVSAWGAPMAGGSPRFGSGFATGSSYGGGSDYGSRVASALAMVGKDDGSSSSSRSSDYVSAWGAPTPSARFGSDYSELTAGGGSYGGVIDITPTPRNSFADLGRSMPASGSRGPF